MTGSVLLLYYQWWGDRNWRNPQTYHDYRYGCQARVSSKAYPSKELESVPWHLDQPLLDCIQLFIKNLLLWIRSLRGLEEVVSEISLPAMKTYLAVFTSINPIPESNIVPQEEGEHSLESHHLTSLNPRIFTLELSLKWQKPRFPGAISTIVEKRMHVPKTNSWPLG